MAPPKLPFDEEDTSTWTHERVRLHVESGKKKLKPFYQNFFGWSAEEYKEALDHTITEVRKYFDLSKKFPTKGPQAKLRHTVQMNLVRDRPDLFVNRHGVFPPAWFDANFISRPPLPYHTKEFDMKNVVQLFIAYSRAHKSGRDRHRSLSKRQNYAEEVDDNDEADDSSSQVVNKRPRTSWLGRTTPLPNMASTSVPPSPDATIPNFQASMNTEPSMGLRFGREGNPYSQVASTSRQKRRVRNPLGLILYITRVTIADQNLVLERDRFDLVENLFEQGRLTESYLQELVFGNPLYDKPTFLWFFDETSKDKPRSVNNRPTAEAAIAMLRVRAERAEATGIQLFDAPDRDTAALVPVHEVTRKSDFVQQVSFELEIDNENDDDDDHDMEEAEMASRVDSAYESRAGELQLDDVTIKKEIESKPDITWAGQQQQQVDGESNSDLEEDEDIGRFYR